MAGINSHQGTIGVESELNGVTSFTVTLHRDANMNMEVSSSADEHVAEHYIIEPQEISEMVNPDKTVKILIVEDNPEMRKVLTQIFEQIYEVYTASPFPRFLEALLHNVRQRVRCWHRFLNKYMMYIRLPTGRKDWSRLLHYNHR